MALRVWLPLNGNINNYGISDITVTNNGATVDNNGKIGKCYKFNGSSSRISSPSLTFKKPISISAWIKPSSAAITTTETEYILSYNTATGGTAGHLLGLGFYGSSHGAGVLTVWANGSIANTQQKLIADTWYHICATLNENNLTTVYLNGLQVYQGIISSALPASCFFTIGGRSNSSTGGVGAAAYLYNGSINDARLYDHCLSPKEVKELAKGLCLHYKLAGPGQENLITTMTAGGRTTLVDKYTLNADFGQNVDTYGYFNVSPALELDKTYTLSFDVLNMPSGSRWGWTLWNNANYSFLVEGNGHHSYTFCPSAAKLPSDYSLTKFLFDDSGRINPAGIVTFTNFKIEKGAIATPWCPHKNDSLYTALGYNNNTEDDCSGFGNNGINSGITIESTSERYSSSYKYSNNSSTTNIAPCFSSGQTQSELTTSIWFKTNTLNNTAPNLISLGENNFWRFRLASTTSIWAYIRVGSTQVATTLSVPSSITSSLIDDRWHFCAVSFKEGIITIYVDGISIGTYNASSTAKYITCGASGSTWHLAGYTSTAESFIGNLSDFRIYATALSDADILELYNTPLSIDNVGNMYTYEFKEI